MVNPNLVMTLRAAVSADGRAGGVLMRPQVTSVEVPDTTRLVLAS